MREAPLDETAGYSLAAKTLCHRELGDLPPSLTLWQDRARSHDVLTVKRDKDLTPALQEVTLRIGELPVVRGLHESVRLQPFTIELCKELGMLGAKWSDRYGRIALRGMS